MAATNAGSTGAAGMFLRKSSGLVKGWSSIDVYFFAFFMVSPVVGFYAISFAPFIPSGSLFWALAVGTALIAFGSIVYAALIAVMPRAGGDYLYQSRVLTGGIGFVLSATGFWFVMAQWAPIYGNIAVLILLAPLAQTAGFSDLATWWNTSWGIFVASLIMIAFGVLVVAVGLRAWARVQRWMYGLGVLALGVTGVLLLTHSHADFVSAFNRESSSLFGATGDSYDKTRTIGAYHAVGLGFPIHGTLLMIPFVLFWNLWYTWSASLHGEVRGATDFRRTASSMALGLGTAFLLMVLLLGTISRTMGWQWYNAANNAYWGGFYGYTHAPPVSLFPYPVMFAGWLVNNAVFQFVLILFAGLSFLGWSSSLFIASTRQIFAAAFDRVLPAWAARVTDRRGVPVGALALIAVPSVVFSALYAYSTTFRTYLFDATVVLAVTFVGTSLAAALLPWRARALYEASAVSRFRIAGIPGVTIAAVLYGGVMVFSIVLWLRDSVYGVNAHESLVYMGALYVVAIVIYVVAKVIRSREGVDLSKAYDEIPAD